MKSLLITAVSFLGFLGADHKQGQAEKVINDSKISKYQDSLTVIRNSRINKPIVTSEPCKETPCDSNGYFSKGIAEGLKRCPVHKDKPCLPEPCPPHKLEVLEVGYVNNKTLYKVIAKCGTDCTEVIKIGVKPIDQR